MRSRGITMNINRVEHFIRNYDAVVPLGSDLDLVEIVVPAKAVMRVLDFGNYIDTPAAWGTIFWEFFHDNLPLYPYEVLYQQIDYGSGRQAVQLVEVHGGHRFRIRAHNPTAGAVRMGISLSYEFEYQE